MESQVIVMPRTSCQNCGGVAPGHPPPGIPTPRRRSMHSGILRWGRTPGRGAPVIITSPVLVSEVMPKIIRGVSMVPV